MDRVIDERAQFAFPQDPSVAWARAKAGLCALQAGRRNEATRLASLARAAFERQPGVSGFYKAPLAELDRVLAAGASRGGRQVHASRSMPHAGRPA